MRLTVPPTPTGPLQPHQQLYLAARKVAVELEHEHPEHCACWRVQVGALAESLGVVVRTNNAMRSRAHWQRRRVDPAGQDPTLWAKESRHVDEIDVRGDLRESTRRFALAHEIGHVVMYRRMGTIAHRLSGERHERFANAFAAELLLSRSHREELTERFRQAADPVALLRLADSVGVSPQTLLRFARRENWLSGLDKGWVDIRVLANRHTGRDTRPRIYDAVFDRERWFLPANRSVTGAFGSDEWLIAADVEVARREGILMLSSRREHALPRFVRALVQVRVAVVRMYRTRGPHGMQFLAHVGLLADRERQPPAASTTQLALF